MKPSGVGEYHTKKGEVRCVDFSDVEVIEKPVRFCYWKPYERASGIQTDFLGQEKELEKISSWPILILSSAMTNSIGYNSEVGLDQM